jgi:nicotinamidase-related amidase
MALSQLDPHAALVVIDLQKGVLGLKTAHPTADVLERSARLARAFREANLPVALVNVAGRAPGRTGLVRPAFTPPPDWHVLAPELDAQPSDILVTKYNIGAFHGTGLDMQLRRRGVTQILLTGVATSSGVEATARAAYDHGYNVVSIVDAMTDSDAEAHRHAVELQLLKIGETATTDEVLAVLAQRQAG